MGNSGYGSDVINMMGEVASALTCVEGRELVGLPADDRHSLCLQVFERQVEIKDGFCPCANNQYRCATQFCQVGRNIHTGLCPPVNTSNPACGKEANAHHTCA